MSDGFDYVTIKLAEPSLVEKELEEIRKLCSPLGPLEYDVFDRCY